MATAGVAMAEVVALFFNSSCFTAAEHCQMSTAAQNIVAGASLHVELLITCTSALHMPLMLTSPQFRSGQFRIQVSSSAIRSGMSSNIRKHSGFDLHVYV